MPCFCWVSEESVSGELLQIRKHIKEVVRLINAINHHGDVPGNGPLPRNILKETHDLLDDFYTGVCKETGKTLPPLY